MNQFTQPLGNHQLPNQQNQLFGINNPMLQQRPNVFQLSNQFRFEFPNCSNFQEPRSPLSQSHPLMTSLLSPTSSLSTNRLTSNSIHPSLHQIPNFLNQNSRISQNGSSWWPPSLHMPTHPAIAAMHLPTHSSSNSMNKSSVPVGTTELFSFSPRLPNLDDELAKRPSDSEPIDPLRMLTSLVPNGDTNPNGFPNSRIAEQPVDLCKRVKCHWASCGESFIEVKPWIEHVLDHVKTLKKQRVKIKTCNWANCKTKFDFPCNLQAHILKLHLKCFLCKCGCGHYYRTISRNYICPVSKCAKVATTNEKLIDHLLKHSRIQIEQMFGQFCRESFVEECYVQDGSSASSTASRTPRTSPAQAEVSLETLTAFEALAAIEIDEFLEKLTHLKTLEEFMMAHKIITGIQINIGLMNKIIFHMILNINYENNFEDKKDKLDSKTRKAKRLASDCMSLEEEDEEKWDEEEIPSMELIEQKSLVDENECSASSTNDTINLSSESESNRAESPIQTVNKRNYYQKTHSCSEIPFITTSEQVVQPELAPIGSNKTELIQTPTQQKENHQFGSSSSTVKNNKIVSTLSVESVLKPQNPIIPTPKQNVPSIANHEPRFQCDNCGRMFKRKCVCGNYDLQSNSLDQTDFAAQSSDPNVPIRTNQIVQTNRICDTKPVECHKCRECFVSKFYLDNHICPIDNVSPNSSLQSQGDSNQSDDLEINHIIDKQVGATTGTVDRPVTSTSWSLNPNLLNLLTGPSQVTSLNQPSCSSSVEPKIKESTFSANLPLLSALLSPTKRLITIKANSILQESNPFLTESNLNLHKLNSSIQESNRTSSDPDPADVSPENSDDPIEASQTTPMESETSNSPEYAEASQKYQKLPMIQMTKNKMAKRPKCNKRFKKSDLTADGIHVHEYTSQNASKSTKLVESLVVPIETDKNETSPPSRPLTREQVRLETHNELICPFVGCESLLFNNIVSSRRHRRMAHFEMIDCKFKNSVKTCGKWFSNTRELLRHMSRKHDRSDTTKELKSTKKHKKSRIRFIRFNSTGQNPQSVSSRQPKQIEIKIKIDPILIPSTSRITSKASKSKASTSSEHCQRVDKPIDPTGTESNLKLNSHQDFDHENSNLSDSVILIESPLIKPTTIESVLEQSLDNRNDAFRQIDSIESKTSIIMRFLKCSKRSGVKWKVSSFGSQQQQKQSKLNDPNHKDPIPVNSNEPIASSAGNSKQFQQMNPDDSIKDQSTEPSTSTHILDHSNPSNQIVSNASSSSSSHLKRQHKSLTFELAKQNYISHKRIKLDYPIPNPPLKIIEHDIIQID